MIDAGLGQVNFSTPKILADYDGDIKIGRIVGLRASGLASCLTYLLAGAAYSEKWQNHPTMLVPLVH